MSIASLESQPLIQEHPIHQRVCTQISNGCNSVLDSCNSYACNLIYYFARCNILQYGVGTLIIWSSRNLGENSDDCSSCSAGMQTFAGIAALSLSLGGLAFNAICLKCIPKPDEREKCYFCAAAVGSVGATILNIVGITMYAMSCSKLSCH